MKAANILIIYDIVVNIFIIFCHLNLCYVQILILQIFRVPCFLLSNIKERSTPNRSKRLELKLRLGFFRVLLMQRRKEDVLIMKYFSEEYIAFHSWRVPRDRTAIKKYRRTFIAAGTPYCALLTRETILVRGRQIAGMLIKRVFPALNVHLFA